MSGVSRNVIQVSRFIEQGNTKIISRQMLGIIFLFTLEILK